MKNVILAVVLLMSPLCYAQDCVLTTRMDDERLEDRRRHYEQVIWERNFAKEKDKRDSITKIGVAKYNANSIKVDINQGK